MSNCNSNIIMEKPMQDKKKKKKKEKTLLNEPKKE